MLGLALELVWIDSPRWLSAFAYLAVGWVGVLAVPCSPGSESQGPCS